MKTNLMKYQFIIQMVTYSSTCRCPMKCCYVISLQLKHFWKLLTQHSVPYVWTNSNL